MLPKKNRVNKALFQVIMKKGRVVPGQFFTFRYLVGISPEVKPLYSQYSQRFNLWEESSIRLACVVPKSIVKKAIIRNQFRRKAYLAIDPCSIKRPGVGILFYKKQGISASPREIKEDIANLLKRGGFI